MFTPPLPAAFPIRTQCLHAFVACLILALSVFPLPAHAFDADETLTAEIRRTSVDDILARHDVHLEGTGGDLVVLLISRSGGWKLRPAPSYKFQRLEGEAAARTMNYATFHQFVARPIVAGTTKVAIALTPINPTPSGVSINLSIRTIDHDARSFDIRVDVIDPSGGASGSGAGGSGAGTATN